MPRRAREPEVEHRLAAKLAALQAKDATDEMLRDQFRENWARLFGWAFPYDTEKIPFFWAELGEGRFTDAVAAALAYSHRHPWRVETTVARYFFGVCWNMIREQREVVS